MRSGRPLRFLALVLGSWTALRAAALWPSLDPVAALTGTTEAVAAERPVRTVQAVPARTDRRVLTREAEHPETAAARPAVPAPILPAPRPVPQASEPAVSMAQVPAITPPIVPTPLAQAPRRFAGSAWLIARGGANQALLGGQLGASQAGVRLTYALGEARRVALAARFATPLRGRGRELGLGVDWQPTRAPLHLVAEQRFAIDGGGSAPAVLAIGGIGPTPVLRGVQLEAYGQAGGIARGRVQGFADGAARLTHPVVLARGMRLELGVGSWGGAQRGAARLDAGPTVGLVVPVAGKAVRLTADWRQRIAGSARPGSGPALSIGTDF